MSVNIYEGLKNAGTPLKNVDFFFSCVSHSSSHFCYKRQNSRKQQIVLKSRINQYSSESDTSFLFPGPDNRS